MNSGKTLFVINRILLVFFVIFLLFLIHTTTQGWNDRSRLATIEQLVNNRTFIINKASIETGDKVYINGFYYSDKPPLFSILAAGPYFILHGFGWNFFNHQQSIIYLITFFVSTFPFLFYFLFLFYFFRKKIELQPEKLLFLLLALFVGTAMFPFATVLNNHLLSAVLCGIAVLLLKYAKLKSFFFLFLLGILFSLATVFDPGSMFVAGFFSLYLIYLLFYQGFNREKLFLLVFYIFGLIVPVLLHWMANIQITGDVFPASMHPEFFKYPGSVFNSDNLTNASFAVKSLKDWLNYVFSMLFGRRGFLSHNPLLILLMVFSVYFIFKKGSSIKDRLFFVATVVSFASIVLYYSLFGKGYSGSTYTVRWFLIFIPLFIPTIIEMINFGKRKMYVLVIILSFVTAIWSVPASGLVFKNVSAYPGWNMKNVVIMFPKYLKHQVKVWQNIF